MPDLTYLESIQVVGCRCQYSQRRGATDPLRAVNWRVVVADRNKAKCAGRDRPPRQRLVRADRPVPIGSRQVETGLRPSDRDRLSLLRNVPAYVLAVQPAWLARGERTANSPEVGRRRRDRGVHAGDSASGGTAYSRRVPKGRVVWIDWRGERRRRRDVIRELRDAGTPVADIARRLGVRHLDVHRDGDGSQ